MKKMLTVIMVLGALVGCDEASKAIEQAQDIANKAVGDIQQQVESFDLEQLNPEHLGGAAQVMAASVEQALTVDFSNPEALTDVEERIANAYSCLVASSSESTASDLMDKLISSVTSNDAVSLIERGIEQATTAQTCVM
ncbi:hypothetical protein [Vibrio neptunius]|uniref:Lipoprotein n=1 Tax=Vibrio neptunius TaxID=170651 RepID=A0ABS3A4N2_9VIBR|nr:hypothetical protein [Vibrio neptunius]MBN3517051.1 hypothetical protein [Vibrio neptunius]MBN3551491.1 hypothetical protein [Vibrio neptunius]MBN3579446.1 hypothetical protein [Vibrio neptunius]MCH9873110.1 hypothetical protein [Vibrio neptunius]